MFSSRVPADRRPNELTRARALARARGRLLDLTVSNPTAAGIRYDPALLAPLGWARGLAYRPHPFGALDAREAVAGTYASRGLDMTPDRVVLTASTSEAYSLLFKLLCDPGDDVLGPVPSYPLFDHLAALDGLRLRAYALEYHGGWTIAAPSLDAAWTPRTRAVLAVSPNNPTGSYLGEEDARELVDRASARGASLVLDEVFAEYPFMAAPANPAAFRDPGCLVFRLGGLSKSAGLPQVKLGWITVDGPPALVAEALDRLELICDTYLSVSTPVQLAAQHFIETAMDARRQILDRVRENHAELRRMCDARAGGASVLHAEGGWSAVMRVPATRSEESIAIGLLERGVVVHPGFFFDFPHEAFLVVSLLPAPAEFREAIGIVLESVDAG